MIEILIGAALAAAADPAEAPRQFDLACEGTTRTMEGPPASPTWTFRLSVDLDAALWCDRTDGCVEVRKIHNASDGIVELTDWDTAEESEQVLFTPKTGALAWNHDFGGKALYFSDGVCTIAPFTPIPASARETDRPWAPTKLPAPPR